MSLYPGISSFVKVSGKSLEERGLMGSLEGGGGLMERERDGGLGGGG